MRFIQAAFIVLLPIFVGCAGVSVQAVIKTPLDDKCGQAGLQGCPELGEGILLYIEGDEVKGKEMVLRAAGANTPANIKKFAKQLKQLNSIPGVGPYAKKVNAIAKLMYADAKARAKAAKASGGAGATAAADPGEQDEDVDALFN